MDVDKLIKDYKNLKNKKIKMLDSDNYNRDKVIEVLGEMFVISDVIFAEYEEQALRLQSRINKKAAILDFVKKTDDEKSDFYKEIEYKIEIEDDQDDLNDICSYMRDEIYDYKDDIETLTLDDENSDNSDLNFIISKINSYDTVYGKFKDSVFYY